MATDHGKNRNVATDNLKERDLHDATDNLLLKVGVETEFAYVVKERGISQSLEALAVESEFASDVYGNVGNPFAMAALMVVLNLDRSGERCYRVFISILDIEKKLE